METLQVPTYYLGMTSGELLFASLNILVLAVTLLAVWRAPIQAVKVGQKLQAEHEVVKNKFNTLAVILGERHAKGNGVYFIQAMNQVPIVFNDSTRTINAFNKFIAQHKKTDGSTPHENELTNSCLNDLIVEMGRDLGYLDMNNSWISEYFYPRAAQLSFDAQYYRDTETVERGQAILHSQNTPQDKKQVDNGR